MKWCKNEENNKIILGYAASLITKGIIQEIVHYDNLKFPGSI